MGASAIENLNFNTEPQRPITSIRLINAISGTSIGGVIERSITGNNPSKHITFDKSIDYNETNSYIERKVIDMKAQLEINKILKVQKNIYLTLFIVSVLGILTSWVPGILSEDIGPVLKPLSIGFSLMIVLHYYLGRAK